jgi:hypothetical protein
VPKSPVCLRNSIADLLLQEVRRIVEEERLVSGKGPLESAALCLAEREVLCPPHDERRPVGKRRQVPLDLRQLRGSLDELPRRDHRGDAAIRLSPRREIEVEHGR